MSSLNSDIFASNMAQSDILSYAINNGIINISYVQEQIEMTKRQSILARHPYEIWEGKNGKWYTYLPDTEKGRRLRKKTSKKAIEDDIVNYYKTNEERPKTFDDVYHHWRSIQDQMMSDNSAVKYDSDYLRYFKDKSFAKKTIGSITEEDIKVFICDTTKEQQLCKKATKTLFGYISCTIQSARINRWIDHNPMEFLRAKQFYKYCKESSKPAEKKIVSDKDMAMLYEQFACDYQKQPEYIPTYAVHFATLTGMRVGEISGLRWDCVNDDYILIDKSEKYNRKTKEYYIDKTKNEKIRIFPITPEIKTLLEKLKKVEMEHGYICEWVFANENGRIHAPVISSCCKNKCIQADIDKKGIHAFRKTLNSKMKCDGVSTTIAASLLGHSEEVNKEYYTFDITGIEDKAKIISKINKKIV